MNAFLAMVLDWLLTKILSFIGKEIVAVKVDQAIVGTAGQDKDLLEKAITPDEKSAAAAALAAHTFKQ